MSDMFSDNEKVGARRFKVASQSGLDSAIIDGRLFAFNYDVTVPANDQMIIDARYSGQTIIKKVCADGLGIKYAIGEPLGNIVYLGSAKNLNLSSPDGYQALFRITDDGFTGEVVLSGIGCIDTPCVPDGRNIFVLTNPSDTDISSSLLILLESTAGFQAPFGLSGSTQLTATTEMINYAPN